MGVPVRKGRVELREENEQKQNHGNHGSDMIWMKMVFVLKERRNLNE